MSEVKTDYKVTVTLDRKRIVEDITKLAQLLTKKNIPVIVSASNKEEATYKAMLRLQQNMGISDAYMKRLQPTKLPT